ncbi:MAG: proprotein convertase P-domain-containing protein, partial [Sulfurovum sp.]|nr:proprotein convertase P-domain-containing protein [Sulfurovum sp.]
NIEKNISIEFIDIYFNTNDHQKLGDLEITLISPYGTKSILAQRHEEAFEGIFKYNNWRFGTMRHLNEYSKGEWKLQVKDLREGNSGTFISWGLKIYGH